MSVIVTGMDMPKNCFECSNYTGENAHCLNNCFIPYRAEDNDSYRNKDCPLKSIDGLIDKFSMVNGCGDFIATYDVINIIKEYCEVKE